MSLFLLFPLRIPDKGLTKNLLFRLQIVFLTTLEHRKQANFQLLTAWLVHFLSTFRPSHLNCLPVWPCRLLPLLHPSSSDCNTPFLDLPHQQLNNAASYLTNKPSPVTPATCVAVLRPLFVACFLFTLLVLPQLWSSYKWYCVLNTATQDSISSQSCLKCWNWEVLCYCMTQSLANVHSRYLQPPVQGHLGLKPWEVKFIFVVFLCHEISLTPFLIHSILPPLLTPYFLFLFLTF